MKANNSDKIWQKSYTWVIVLNALYIIIFYLIMKIWI